MWHVRRGALLVLMLGGSARAAEPWHWEIDGGGYEGYARDRDGAWLRPTPDAIEAWVGGAWVVRAPGAPARADDLAVAPDGRVWIGWGSPGQIASWDGTAWSATEPMGGGIVRALEVDPLGRLYLSTTNGELWVREVDGPPTRLLVGGSSELSATMVPDADGTWLQRGTGWFARVESGVVREVALPAPGLLLVKAASGVPVLVGDAGAYAWTGDAWVQRSARPTSAAGWWDDRLWLLGDGALRQIDPDGEIDLPLPEPGVPGWVADPEGGPLVVRYADGLAFRVVSGRVPTLRLWTVGEVAEAGAWAADLDGDGAEELVAVDVAGELVAQRWAGARFERLRGWSVAAGPPVVTATACDTDGDGDDDLAVLRKGSARLEIQRTLDGWFEPVEVPLADGTRIDEDAGVHCVDVDADGDLDLVATSIVREGWHPSLVVLFENVGQGRLVRVDLPHRSPGAPGWPADVVVEDLDGDGLRDVFVAQVWGTGHTLFQGLPGGGLRDVSASSGVRGVYPTARQAWAVRVDADELPELLVYEPGAGMRGYRNLGGMRFRDATHALGLPWRWPNSRTEPGATTVEDLDGDGHVDLVGCAPKLDCRLSVGVDGGFVDRTGALLGAGAGARGLVPLDADGDGDRELLVVRGGPDRLLENRADPGVALRPVATTSWFTRRAVWLRGWDVVGLAAALLAGGVAHVWVRRAGSRLFWGARAGWGAAAVGLAAAWFGVIEWPWAWRGGLVAIGVVGPAAAAWAEVRIDRARRATRVAGYRLVERLGAGGMGTVYRAVPPGGGPEVALKLVNPDVLARDADRRLFRREAELGASVVDPRVVRIFAWGEWSLVEGGETRPTAWLAMELVDGVTLRSLLDERRVLPVGEACAVARQVALALDTVHAHGVVHRDVKPENVMLRPAAAPMLMDFGAAREAGRVTRSARQVLGTLGYLAPEQGRGLPPDPRSDVYALGVVLYEMLGGRRPFAADDLVTLLAQVLESEPAPIERLRPDAPPEVAALVRRALAKDPEQRFPTAASLADALGPFAGELPKVGARRARGTGVVVGSETETASTGWGRLVADLFRVTWRLARGGRSATLVDVAAALLEEAERQGGTTTSSETLSRLVRTGQRLAGERTSPITRTSRPAPEREERAPSDGTWLDDQPPADGEDP